MFGAGSRGGGRRGAAGVGSRDGPVAIPRGERIQLKRFESNSNFDANNNNVGSTPTISRGSSDDVISKANTAASSLLNLSKVSTTATAVVKATEKVVLPPADEAVKAPTWYGQTLEYAAGVALRERVLKPIREKEEEQHDSMELSRMLSLYSRGELILLKHQGQILPASIDRISQDDSAALRSWWETDKFLPYTSLEWSNWWIRRCHLFDPGCEMIGLKLDGKNLLGVAYFERNLVDRRSHNANNKNTSSSNNNNSNNTSNATNTNNNNNVIKNRITLIRGIRLNPQVNPEALRRKDVFQTAERHDVPCTGIASLLMAQILFLSLRYGTHAVAVNCPKDDRAEAFYQRFMGKPTDVDNETGRRYYRMSAKHRFHLLQKAFQRQIVLVSEVAEPQEKTQHQPQQRQLQLQKEKTHQEHNDLSVKKDIKSVSVIPNRPFPPPALTNGHHLNQPHPLSRPDSAHRAQQGLNAGDDNDDGDEDDENTEDEDEEYVARSGSLMKKRYREGDSNSSLNGEGKRHRTLAPPANPAAGQYMSGVVRKRKVDEYDSSDSDIVGSGVRNIQQAEV